MLIIVDDIFPFVICFRLVDGLKSTAISFLLPPLEGHPMRLHSLNLRDLLCYSRHSYKAGLYRKHSDLLISLQIMNLVLRL